MEHPHKEPAANHKLDILEHYIRRASKQGKIKNSKLFGKLYPKSMTATLSRSTVALFYRVATHIISSVNIAPERWMPLDEIKRLHMLIYYILLDPGNCKLSSIENDILSHVATSSYLYPQAC